MAVVLTEGGWQSVLVCAAIVSPFPFYWALWNYPQAWVRWCGPEVDPCHRMAHFAHLFKLVQFAALFSVSTFSWPPFFCWILIAFGQFLNFRVYQLLGEDGVYYGVRFGKTIPWVHEFPFGYMRDPQYIGSTLCLAGCFFWVPWPYLLLWSSCYLLLSFIEGKEDVQSRAKLLKA
eukprot:c13235_g1_i1 orf=67-591(+)